MLPVCILQVRVCQGDVSAQNGDVLVTHESLQVIDRHARPERPQGERAAERVRLDVRDSRPIAKTHHEVNQPASSEAFASRLGHPERRLCPVFVTLRQVLHHLLACLQSDEYRALLLSLAVPDEDFACFGVNVAHIEGQQLGRPNASVEHDEDHRPVAFCVARLDDLLRFIVCERCGDQLLNPWHCDRCHRRLGEQFFTDAEIEERSERPGVLVLGVRGQSGFLSLMQELADVVSRNLIQPVNAFGAQPFENQIQRYAVETERGCCQPSRLAVEIEDFICLVQFDRTNPQSGHKKTAPFLLGAVYYIWWLRVQPYATGRVTRGDGRI